MYFAGSSEAYGIEMPKNPVKSARLRSPSQRSLKSLNSIRRSCPQQVEADFIVGTACDVSKDAGLVDA